MIKNARINYSVKVLKYFCNLILHSLSCKFIAIINSSRIHYPNIYLDNGIMKIPKHGFIWLIFTCLGTTKSL